MTDKERIDRIRQGEKHFLKEVYLNNRTPFVRFLQKQFQASEEDALETYQFSILRLYDNIVYGRLTELSSSLQTYLFSIGKNVYREQLRLKQKENPSDTQFLLRLVMDENTTTQDEVLLQEKEIKYKKMAAGLLKMGNPCKALLEYFYYDKWSMQQIADALGFKNTNVAKTKKGKCLKRLKNLVQTNILHLQNG